MADSFYFYDLETSSTNPRTGRIMQFAGQRTDLDLNPIGEPHNILIALSEDVLPEPDAILVTGITPQHTLAEGTTEVEFLKLFFKEIATPGTIFLGFNSVRFDDEFMRSIMYRNFYDPYQWQWKDGRSRWDLLDVVRMTRALRPDGIVWPVDKEGKATNRLELLTAQNGLDHSQAHDALNDVLATIALAKLLREKQPKIFNWLLKVRDKQSVRSVVKSGQPFVYTSGKYPSEYEKTTVVSTLTENGQGSGALVFDLRYDPTPFAAMTAAELVEAWTWQKPEDRDPAKPRLPIKTLKYNRCPAVAPLAVLDSDSQKRLHINTAIIRQHQQKLADISVWPERILEALNILDGTQQQTFAGLQTTVDEQMYEGFFNDSDSKLLEAIRRASPEDLGSFIPKCQDKRLRGLLPLYKARNFPKKLTDQERQVWETYKTEQLLAGGTKSKLARYFARIEEISKRSFLTQTQRYLLEDLLLYGQSLLPGDSDVL